MDAEQYDQWYETPRGKWIGQREVQMLVCNLTPRSHESVLDVGCGTGYFTRELGRVMTGPITGVDINPDWIQTARRKDPGRAVYQVADAQELPFPTASVDLVVAITSLCFVADFAKAVREMVRVARRRVAVGLLNRHSLLWLQKRRSSGTGSYQGARWHTVCEARRLFDGLPVTRTRVSTGIYVPSGGKFAQWIEPRWPQIVPIGAFILVVGDVFPDRVDLSWSPCGNLDTRTYSPRDFGP